MLNISHNTVLQPFTCYPIITSLYPMIFFPPQIIPLPSGPLQRPIIPIPVRLQPVVNGPLQHTIVPIPVIRPTPIRAVNPSSNTEISRRLELARGSAVSSAPNLETGALESTSSKIDSLASSSLASQDPELSTNSRHAFHVVVRSATSSNLTNKAPVTAVDNLDQSSSNGVASKLAGNLRLRKRHLATGQEITSSTMMNKPASNSSTSSSKRARVGSREAKDPTLSSPAEVKAWNDQDTNNLIEKCQKAVKQENEKKRLLSESLSNIYSFFKKSYSKPDVIERIKQLKLFPADYFENRTPGGHKTKWTLEESNKLLEAYEQGHKPKHIAEFILPGKTVQQIMTHHQQQKKRMKPEKSSKARK